MFKFVVIATIIVLASTTSTGYESVFAQFPQSDFSTSMSSLLQMHSMNEDAEGRLNEISNLLNEIQALINSNQEEADARIERTRAQCASDIATLNGEIESKEQILEDTRSEQTNLNAEQSEKQNQLRQLDIEIESTQGDIQDNEDSLVEENNAFAQYSTSFEDAITACQEAIKLMRVLAQQNHGSQEFIQTKRNSGIMFVQLSQRFSEVKEILQSHIKEGGPAAFVQPIVDILTEMSTQNSVDVGKVDQIIKLITTLLERLQAGLQSRREENTRTVNDLNKLIASLETQLTKLNTQRGILSDRLEEISVRLTHLSGLIASTETLLGALQKTLAETESECENAEKVYESESRVRSQNLAILEELINHFNSSVDPSVSNVREGQVEAQPVEP